MQTLKTNKLKKLSISSLFILLIVLACNDDKHKALTTVADSTGTGNQAAAQAVCVEPCYKVLPGQGVILPIDSNLAASHPGWDVRILRKVDDEGNIAYYIKVKRPIGALQLDSIPSDKFPPDRGN
jgi:hypothetical protein